MVDVEAIVQDAALQIWKEPFRIVPDGRSGFLRRYATTVALNAARNAATRAGRERPPLSLRDLIGLTDDRSPIRCFVVGFTSAWHVSQGILVERSWLASRMEKVDPAAKWPLISRWASTLSARTWHEREHRWSCV